MLDLAGTLVLALNGALTVIRSARLDIEVLSVKSWAVPVSSLSGGHCY